MEREANPQEPDSAPADTTPVATIPEARAVTKARARDLRSLLWRYILRHMPPGEARTATIPEPPKMTGAYRRLLPVLKAVPWLLGALFFLSFFWDFPGYDVAIAGYTLSAEGLLRILSVSGLIGFLTNWLAITMLFHPRKRRPIFGQGLIPAQRERVIYRLATAISQELISEKIIKEKIEQSGVIAKYRVQALGVARGVLEDPEFRQDLKVLTAGYVEQVLGSEEVRRKVTEILVEKIEQYAGQGVGGWALKAYRLLNEADFQRRIDSAVRELPASLDVALDNMDHLLDRIPEKLEARSEDIETWATRIILGFVEKLDIYEMITTNMRAYDEQQLERLLMHTANEQLNYIKYLGGILGVVGGLVIWRPLLSLVVFGVVGIVLLALDRMLAAYRPAAQEQV